MKQFPLSYFFRNKLFHEYTGCWNEQNPCNRPPARPLLRHRAWMNFMKPEHDFFIDRNLRRVVFYCKKLFGKLYHSCKIIIGFGAHDRTNKVRKIKEQLQLE